MTSFTHSINCFYNHTFFRFNVKIYIFTGLIFVVFGRGRLFFVENREKILSEIKAAAIILGLKLLVNGTSVSVNQCRASRARLGVDDGLPTLAEFFVEKHTPKHGKYFKSDAVSKCSYRHSDFY